jgi:hypothetical protein
MDESYNGNMIRIMDNDIYHYKRSDTIKLDDIIKLGYGESTPSNIEVLSVNCINKTIINDLTEDEKDYNIGTYYDRITSGEDVSKLFQQGDILPEHRLLSRPYIEITGRVSSLVVNPDINKAETLPSYLDTSRTISDMIGICLILLLAVIVSASAVSYQSDDISISMIFQHLLAVAISTNVLIPSMKMSILDTSSVF